MSDLSYPGESASVGDSSLDEEESAATETTGGAAGVPDVSVGGGAEDSHGSDVDAAFDDDSDASEAGPAGM